MHQFNTGKLPKIFDSFFVKTSCKHNVNIRFASRSTFYLPKIRTNYGKFNIDLMDLNYGMNSMKDSSVVLPINLKKNYNFEFH